MGFRFRKSVKIAPGVRLNFGKKSTSISLGGKGARYTVSSTGRKTASVGIPGTGLSYVETVGGTDSGKDCVDMPTKKSGTKAKKPVFKKWWFWIIVVVLIGSVASSPDSSDTADDIQDEETSQITDVVQDNTPNDATPPVDDVEAEEPADEAPVDDEPDAETEPPVATPPVDDAPQAEQEEEPVSITYVLNTNTMRFHFESCSSVKDIMSYNKATFTGSRDEVIAKGYQSCGRCHP